MSLHLLISFISFFFSIAFGFFVLLDNRKNKINKLFFLLCSLITVWIFTNIIVDIVHIYGIALFFTRLATVIGAAIPLVFFQLVWNLYPLESTHHPKLYRNYTKISYILFGLITIFSGTKFNIESIIMHDWGIEYSPGVLYYFLFFYLVATFGVSFVYLFIVHKKSEKPQKSQAKLLIIGTILALGLILFLGVVLPILGNSYLAEFAPASIIIYVGFLAIAILEHHLFNIRVIAIEVVTCALWVTLLIRILLSTTQEEILIGGGLLVITVIFGILLIRSTLNEINQQAQIEKLSDELRKAYARSEGASAGGRATTNNSGTNRLPTNPTH